VITLNNGVQMPAPGLGVFQSSPEETAGAVEAAIAGGYRLIGTAAAYLDEREVSEGTRRSGIDRADVFRAVPGYADTADAAAASCDLPLSRGGRRSAGRRAPAPPPPAG
jgi:diketogulonate reductase-like aldo/keto reductase